MATNVIQERVVEFLVQTTGNAAVAGDTELHESGLIDSLTMMDLLVFIESEFGVRLDFVDLTPEQFSSPRSISRLIDSRLSGRSAAA